MSRVENPFVMGEQPRTRKPLQIRADAAQATLDKYRDAPFALGTVDCVQIVKFHLREMGRPLKFGKPIRYRTPLQARGMLRALGFGSVGEALSSRFEEIVPAACLVGDIMELAALEDEQTKGLGALVIYLGNNAVFGFHEGAEGGTVMRIGEAGTDAPLRGWRVL